jgi:hypothetical protein
MGSMSSRLFNSNVRWTAIIYIKTVFFNIICMNVQDLAGKLDDFEFRAALTVAYYSSAFAFF